MKRVLLSGGEAEAIRELIGVFRRDFFGLLRSNLPLKMWWLFAAVLSGAVLWSWPASYPIAQFAWPPSVAWWAYVTTLFIGFFALANAAQVFTVDSQIPLRDWMLYGNVRLLPFLLSKLLTSLSLTLGWLLLSLPFLALALQVAPSPGPRLASLAVFWFGLSLVLTLWGLWLAGFASRAFRIAAVDTVFVLLFAGTFLVRGFGGSSWELATALNPLIVVSGLTGTSPLPPGTWLPPPTGVPWRELIALYGGLAVAGSALALMEMKRWQRSDMPSQRDHDAKGRS